MLVDTQQVLVSVGFHNDVTITSDSVKSEGFAILDCTIADTGELRDCVVLSESPPLKEIAAEAMEAARATRLKIGTGQGEFQSGIHFKRKFVVKWPGLVPGYADIGCIITAQGGVSDCKVVTEVPEGHGLGASALSLTPITKVGLTGEGGTSTVGQNITMRVSFKSPD